MTPPRWPALLLAAVTALGCAEPSGLRVLAAASLTEVVTELAAGFDGPVVTSFGSSSALARQIRDGAPADVFVSASRDWIALLADAGALAGEPVLVARNRLVAVAPLGSPLVGRVGDAATLVAALDDGARLGIADPGVPAGEAARAALDRLGLLGRALPRAVGQSDVRAVLVAVERGELDAGLVYATDARIAEVEVLFSFDPASHPPIEIWAAVLAAADRPEEAARFVDELARGRGREILRAGGFALP